jgi:hypothetical protein
MQIRITKIVTEDFGQFEISDEDLKDCTLDAYLEDWLDDMLHGNFPDKTTEEVVEYKNSDGQWVPLHEKPPVRF